MSQRNVVFPALFLASLISTAPLLADEPVDHGPVDYFNVVRLPGSDDLRRIRTATIPNSGNQKGVYYQDWSAATQTWGANTLWFNTYQNRLTSNPITTFDSQNKAHIFQFGPTNIGDSDLSIFHYGQYGLTGPVTTPAPKKAYQGRVGSIMNAIRIKPTPTSNRIIVPYADTTVITNAYTSVSYSDDYGATWTNSASQLTIPVDPAFNGASLKTAEPTIVQKTDKLWMLMRTSSHKLAQSTSTDNGTTWSAATAAPFHSSTGPAATTRLANGNLVVVWNNARLPDKLGSTVWYAGRDALHAAISTDNGETWKGFREVYLDPNRNLDPYAAGITGDSGTAYPFIAPRADGKVEMIAGQLQTAPLSGWTPARRQLTIDPAWLLERNRSEDFQDATDPLQNVSVFRPYGTDLTASIRRHRDIGAAVVADPVNSANNVLNLKRTDTAKDADGATWNFPALASGRTSMRVRFTSGFAGGSIGLTDRFFNPTDSLGEEMSFFKLNIPSSRVIGSTTLSANTWYDLTLDWNAFKEKAVVRLNGTAIAALDKNTTSSSDPYKQIEYLHGMSYLRLRSAAAGSDTTGFFVDDLSAKALIQTARMSTATANSALANTAGWTSVRFDDYVPNTNPTGTFSQAFSSPTSVMSAAKIRVSMGSGNVVFNDTTSMQVTSDIAGAKSGNTVTITFADTGGTPGAVSAVAFRYGSVLAYNVSVRLLDINGNELPDFEFEELPETVTGTSIGWTALDDGVEVSAIHQIVLSGASSDGWLLGTFALSPLLNDLAYRGFTTSAVSYSLAVPEPTACSLLLAGTCMALRRRTRSAR